MLVLNMFSVYPSYREIELFGWLLRLLIPISTILLEIINVPKMYQTNYMLQMLVLLTDVVKSVVNGLQLSIYMKHFF